MGPIPDLRCFYPKRFTVSSICAYILIWVPQKVNLTTLVLLGAMLYQQIWILLNRERDFQDVVCLPSSTPLHLHWPVIPTLTWEHLSLHPCTMKARASGGGRSTLTYSTPGEKYWTHIFWTALRKVAPLWCFNGRAFWQHLGCNTALIQYILLFRHFPKPDIQNCKKIKG